VTSRDCCTPLDWVFNRVVVNRARLRAEVSAGAMKLCSVAGMQDDTQRGEQPHPCRIHTDKVAIRAVLHPKGDIDGYRVGNVGFAVAGPRQRHRLGYCDRNRSKPLALSSPIDGVYPTAREALGRSLCLGASVLAVCFGVTRHVQKFDFKPPSDSWMGAFKPLATFELELKSMSQFDKFDVWISGTIAKQVELSGAQARGPCIPSAMPDHALSRGQHRSPAGVRLGAAHERDLR
jgi:hypothetical protein